MVRMLIDVVIFVTLFNKLSIAQPPYLALTCSVYKNITGLITKGYHGCKFCGPLTKIRWFECLPKLVYDCSRIFLLDDHPYRRATSYFNGKPKRTRRPAILTPTHQLKEYDTRKEKRIAELFDSNGEPMFNDPKFFDTYVEKIPIGMKMNCAFHELPY